jgi:CheY-like chemotaxis protein
MDIQMPELDGLETTRRIREEMSSTKQPRIIAMTANAMQGDREMCLQAGMDDYISKPIRIEALVSALSKSSPIPDSQKSENQGNSPVSNEASEPAADNILEVLDKSELEQLLDTIGGDFEILVELIDTFLEEAPGLIEGLNKAVRDNDVSEVNRLSHSLKSNGADYGAKKFSQLCKTLEMQARSGDLNGSAGLAGEITVEYARMEKELIAVKNQGSL